MAAVNWTMAHLSILFYRYICINGGMHRMRNQMHSDGWWPGSAGMSASAWVSSSCHDRPSTHPCGRCVCNHTPVSSHYTHAANGQTATRLTSIGCAAQVTRPTAHCTRMTSRLSCVFTHMHTHKNYLLFMLLQFWRYLFFINILNILIIMRLLVYYFVFFQ